MKKIISLLGVFSLLLIAHAQPTASPTDKKADDILKSVSTKYKSFKSVKTTFDITIENPKDKTKEVQSGTIFLKGDKYRLEFAGQVIVSDGKTRWTYVKDANEIQIDNQKTDENSMTPTNLFTMYEKGFLSRYTGEEIKKGKTLQFIELVPVDAKKKNFFKVKLTIHKNDKYIVEAKLFDKNGSTQTISINKLIPDACDESLFSFNSADYKGAEVVDLR